MARGHPPIVITVCGIPKYVIQPYRRYKAEVLRAYAAGRLDRTQAIDLLGSEFDVEVQG